MKRRLAAAVVLGTLEPYAEIVWKCRAPLEASEACVWGRAYLPLGRWIAPLVVAPVAFAVLTVIAAGWRAAAGRWR